MRMMAGWLEKISADGKRLKPREVVAEFDKHLHDELDLVRGRQWCPAAPKHAKFEFGFNSRDVLGLLPP